MKDTDNNEKEYDIEIDPNATWRRVYDFLPYSPCRIKQILKDYYNAELKCIRAYKEGRYPEYRQRYNIHDITTGKLIRENVRLDDLRHFFANKDFPLKENNGRNPKASYFLAAVKAIAEEQAKKNS